MLGCFSAVLAVLDERNYIKFNGRPCTWLTDKPRRTGERDAFLKAAMIKMRADICLFWVLGRRRYNPCPLPPSGLPTGLPFVLFVGLDGAGKTTIISTLQQANFRLPSARAAGDKERGSGGTGQDDGHGSGGRATSGAASNPLAGLPIITPATQHGTLSLITTLSRGFVAIDVPGAAAYRSMEVTLP